SEFQIHTHIGQLAGTTRTVLNGTQQKKTSTRQEEGYMDPLPILAIILRYKNKSILKFYFNIQGSKSLCELYNETTDTHGTMGNAAPRTMCRSKRDPQKVIWIILCLAWFLHFFGKRVP
ncbi:hypothetical protein ACJX0J_031446, partial [Zea mays]